MASVDAASVDAASTTESPVENRRRSPSGGRRITTADIGRTNADLALLFGETHEPRHTIVL
jgi:hypothetical protein